MSNAWWKSAEDHIEEISFSGIQNDLYRAKARYEHDLSRIKEKYGLRKLPAGVYPLWKPLRGRGRLGEFALVVAREHYRKRGYSVWASGSDKEVKDRFILVSFPGLRKQLPLHPAYARMVRIFGSEKIEELNRTVDKEKRKKKGHRNLGGGDPDLFVFKKGNPRKGFFVEVKYKDQPTQNQLMCFPRIDEKLGEIKLARVECRS